MSQKRKRRKFSQDFKEKAVRRMVAGERPTVLSKELGVLRKDLYEWKKAYKNGEPLVKKPGPKIGSEAQGGSELKRARQRVAELERKVGQQALELDFFAKALRCINEAEATTASKRSVSSSERKQRKAN
jgi:transposase-like protein